MKITISQEGTSPISITVPDNINNKPEVKSSEGIIGGILTGLVLFPFVAFAILSVALGIETAIDNRKYNVFCKKNRVVVEKITKLLTDSLNNTIIKHIPNIKKDAKNICDSINKLNDAYDFSVADDLDDYLKPEKITRSFLKEIVKYAKNKTGKMKLESGVTALFYTGVDLDKLPDSEDSWWNNGNDGWGGIYDKAYNESLKQLNLLKKKYPIISDVSVDIAGDDFGGSGNIYFNFIIDVTEIHKLLQEIDTSRLGV